MSADIKSGFLCRNLLFRIKSSITMVILSFVFGGLAFIMPTLIAFIIALQTPADGGDLPTWSIFNVLMQLFLAFTIFGVLSVFALGILSILAPSVTNRHYNNKCHADMYYSLPLTNNRRFITDILSAIITVIIPALMCAVVGYGLYSGTLGVSLSKMNTEETEGFSQLFGIGAEVLLNLFLIYISFAVFSYFICVCCGKTGSAIILTVGAAVALPAFVAVVVNCMIANVNGVNAYDITVQAISYAPPFGLLISFILDLLGKIFIGGASSTASDYLRYLPTRSTEAIVTLLVIMLVLTVASYIIHRIRKPEKAESAHVFGAVYHVIALMAVAMVIGSGVMLANGVGKEHNTTAVVFIAGAVILTFIIYMLCETIRHKGFSRLKELFYSFARYTLCAVGSVILFNLAINSNGMGMGQYIPDKSQIDKIYVNSEYFPIYENISHWINYPDKKDYEGAVFETDGDISKATEMHELIINSNQPTGNEFQITYILKNGTKVVRGYQLKTDSDILRSVNRTFTSTDYYKDAIFRLYNKGNYEWELGVRLRDRYSYYTKEKTDKFWEVFSEEFTIYKNERKATVASLSITALYNDDAVEAYTVYIDSRYEKTLELLYELAPDSSTENDANWKIGYKDTEIGHITRLEITDELRVSEQFEELLSYTEWLDFSADWNSGFIFMYLDASDRYYVPKEHHERAVQLIEELEGLAMSEATGKARS